MSSRPTSTSSVSIPQTAAAGGLTMTVSFEQAFLLSVHDPSLTLVHDQSRQQPPTTAEASYYKIAENALVTFGWNLTSL